jgi:hypothetical protein
VRVQTADCDRKIRRISYTALIKRSEIISYGRITLSRFMKSSDVSCHVAILLYSFSNPTKAHPFPVSITKLPHPQLFQIQDRQSLVKVATISLRITLSRPIPPIKTFVATFLSACILFCDSLPIAYKRGFFSHLCFLPRADRREE